MHGLGSSKLVSTGEGVSSAPPEPRLIDSRNLLGDSVEAAPPSRLDRSPPFYVCLFLAAGLSIELLVDGRHDLESERDSRILPRIHRLQIGQLAPRSAPLMTCQN
jgi:hypothetical protein